MVSSFAFNRVETCSVEFDPRRPLRCLSGIGIVLEIWRYYRNHACVLFQNLRDSSEAHAKHFTLNTMSPLMLLC